MSFSLHSIGQHTPQLRVLGPFPSRKPGSMHNSEVTFLVEPGMTPLLGTFLLLSSDTLALLADGNSMIGACLSPELAG